MDGLRSRLEAVDSAIQSLLAKAEQYAPPAAVGGTKVIERRPFGPIDTASLQWGCCPSCFTDMPLSQLRSHMSHSCSSNLVVCFEAGCNATFPQNELKRHLDCECRVVLRRKKLLKDADLRKGDQDSRVVVDHGPLDADEGDSESISSENGSWKAKPGIPYEQNTSSMYVCPLCEESFPSSKSDTHKDLCQARIVFCPNRSYGCSVGVKFSGIRCHLLNECIAERRKIELIERCNKRKELVRCVGCGDLFPLRDLRHHEEHDCHNRKVPCRNAHLGCPVVLRASMRKAHEEVDNLRARTRYCLYLSGAGAHIALNEDDIVAPWTAEYWMYRPSPKESAKQYIRAALQLVPAFIDAFSVECRAKDRVDAITLLLGDKSARRNPDEMVEAMESLGVAVEVFEDAAVAAVSSAKALGCAIGAAQSCLAEFLPASHCTMHFSNYSSNEFPYQSTDQIPPLLAPNVAYEFSSLRLQPPGEASLDRKMDRSRADTRKKSRNDSHRSNSVVPVSDGIENIAVDPLEMIQPDSLQQCETHSAYQDLAGDPDHVSFENPEGEDAAIFCDDIPDTKKDDAGVKNSGYPAWRREMSAPHSSALAALLSLPTTFVSPNSYNVPSVGTPFTPLGPTALCDDRGDTLGLVPFARESLPLPVLFLLQALFRDRRAGAGHGVLSPQGFHSQLSWADWWAVTVLLADALWDDKKTLASVEQASGLLGKQRKEKDDNAEIKPMIVADIETEYDNANSGNEAEAEKKALRKERTRLRREAKMKKAQLATVIDVEVPEINSKNSDESNMGAEVNDGKSSNRERQRLARKHLRDRLVEADRAACGSELLCWSSTSPMPKEYPGAGVGGINRICLEMAPCPLSWKPKQDAEKPAFMLRHEDIKKLKRDNGKRVDKAKDASESDATSFDTERSGGGLDVRDSAVAGRIGVVLAECQAGGPGCFSFPCGVPRERWCHVALVACPDPNRLVLYLDGRMCGMLRDCALPLPFYSVGAPSLFSLSAALLDVRLWSKLRSQPEIQACMGRLIQLESTSSPCAPSVKGGQLNPIKASPEVPHTSNGELDLSSSGLVMWLPFEDGVGAVRVYDVTEQRYPAPLSRNVLSSQLQPPSIFESMEESKTHDADFIPVKPGIEILPDVSPPPSRPNDPTRTTAVTSRAKVVQHVYRPKPWFWLDADGLPLPHALPLPPGETDRPLPLPAFSSKGVCPFELRRLRLAQRGRQLYKEVNCPRGCNQTLLKKDVRFHMAFECEHRDVACRFSPHCNATYSLSQRGFHESPDRCTYVCARLKQWRRATYQIEPVNCESCGEQVRRRELLRHLLRSCPHRQVPCSLGCGMILQAHRVGHHERIDCMYARERAFMVLRARQRTGYSRPWALEIAFSVSDLPG